MGAIFQGDELLIILVILLLILGPTKLPALARGLGKAIREFKKASAGFYDEEPAPGATQASAGPPKAQALTTEVQVDDKTITSLAERLGISAEGKSSEELKVEVVKRAREKGLI